MAAATSRVAARRLAQEVAGGDAAQQGQPVGLHHARFRPAAVGPVAGEAAEPIEVEQLRGRIETREPLQLRRDFAAGSAEALVPVGRLVALAALVENGVGQQRVR